MKALESPTLEHYRVRCLQLRGEIERLEKARKSAGASADEDVSVSKLRTELRIIQNKLTRAALGLTPAMPESKEPPLT
jgi:hypothetical protein